MRWRSRSEKNSRPSNGREESPVTVVNAFEGCGIECRGDDGAMGGFAEVCAELANGTKSTIPIRAAQMLARTTIIVASRWAWMKERMAPRRWRFWSAWLSIRAHTQPPAARLRWGRKLGVTFAPCLFA